MHTDLVDEFDNIKGWAAQNHMVINLQKTKELVFRRSNPRPVVLPVGLTENDGHENDGPSKLQDMKLQDMKKTDQIAGHEIAGHEIARHEIRGQTTEK